MKTLFRVAKALPLVVVAFVACGGQEKGGTLSGAGGTGGTGVRPEETGSVCKSDGDCFADVADGDLQGEALCLTRVRDGYCTHTCQNDDDCCAAAGECKTDLAEVCSPFESMGDNYCFLSCESADVAAAPDVADDQAYCQRYASPDFICRSSGGGANNRKICVPGTCGVGADCTTAADCASGLDCVSTFNGGYCTQSGCTANADCPADSLCAKGSDGKNYCFHSCSTDSDCSLCRHDPASASCRSDATFVEATTTGSVCVPGS